MNKNQLKRTLAEYLGDDYDSSKDEQVLSLLIDKSWDTVRAARKYPASLKREAQDKDIEENFWSFVFDLVLHNFNKRGIEGEISHSEGGTTQTFETPQSVLKGISPVARVI